MASSPRSRTRAHHTPDMDGLQSSILLRADKIRSVYLSLGVQAMSFLVIQVKQVLDIPALAFLASAYILLFFPGSNAVSLAIPAAYWWISLVAFVDQWFDLELDRVVSESVRWTITSSNRECKR